MVVDLPPNPDPQVTALIDHRRASYGGLFRDARREFAPRAKPLLCGLGDVAVIAVVVAASASSHRTSGKPSVG